MSVAKGFRQLKQEWESILKEQSQDIGTFLNACSLIIMEHCGKEALANLGICFSCSSQIRRSTKRTGYQHFCRNDASVSKRYSRSDGRTFFRTWCYSGGEKTLIDAFVPSANCLSVCRKSEN